MHLPIGRTLLDLLRQSQFVRELIAFLAALLHKEPADDTSIAWEDGEADDGADPRR